MVEVVFLSGIIVGYVGGCIVALYANGFLGCCWRCVLHIVRKLRNKLAPRHEEIVNKLSLDTQIILRQYMSLEEQNGKKVYVVRNIKRFDELLTVHIAQKLNSNFEKGYSEFYEGIKKCLADGSGFVVILNGKEYVAVPLPFAINTDGTID